MKEIPLTPRQSSTFSIVLPVVEGGERQYQLTFKYNRRMQLWTVDVEYLNEPLMLGVALVGGKIMFSGYAVEGMPAQTLVLDLSNRAEDAVFNTLGVEVVYFHFTENELEEVRQFTGDLQIGAKNE